MIHYNYSSIIIGCDILFFLINAISLRLFKDSLYPNVSPMYVTYVPVFIIVYNNTVLCNTWYSRFLSSSILSPVIYTFLFVYLLSYYLTITMITITAIITTY